MRVRFEPDFRRRRHRRQRPANALGAAWRKTSGSGKPYLSITLDGPTLAEPTHCALTRHPESGAYRLVWNRPERRAATDEAEAM
jgi:uncharacterized protein (DUF736 family)